MNYLVLTFGFILSIVLFPTFFVHKLVRLFGKLFFKVKVNGLENIPKKGGALLVANHISYLDFIITTLSIKRPVRFVMYKDVFEKRFLRVLLKRLKMIPISPRGGQNDLNEFNKTCQELIKQGELVIIFSEGTVSRNGQIQEFKRGIEHIASGISQPIIPIYYGGLLNSPFTFDIQNNKFWKLQIKHLRKEVYTFIGKPLTNFSTAFEVRQEIIDLEAQSYEKRIPENAQIINALNTRKGFASFQKTNKLFISELKKEIINKAIQIKKSINNYLEIGVLIENEEELKTTLLALNLLGKTPVILSTQKSKIENMKICRKLHLHTVISDVDHTVSHHTIRLKNHMYSKSKALSKLPVRFLKTYFKNHKNKWNNAVILTENGIEKLSHQQIIGLSMSLSAVNSIQKYGKIASISPIYSSLGYITKVILPLVSGIQVQSSINSQTNTVIGKTSELLKLGNDLKMKEINYVISDEFSDQIKPYLRSETETLKGCGVQGIAPILSLNVPNYSGKDIAGKELSQLSNKPNTAGRFLPGIAYRIIDPTTMKLIIEPNKVGKLFIKSVNSSYDSAKEMMKWIDTGLFGKIDPQGFLELTQM